eukprot:gene1568-32954_t
MFGAVEHSSLGCALLCTQRATVKTLMLQSTLFGPPAWQIRRIDYSRIGAFSKAELRLQFLQCRDEWLSQLLEELDSSDSYEYVKNLIMMWHSLHMFVSSPSHARSPRRLSVLTVTPVSFWATFTNISPLSLLLLLSIPSAYATPPPQSSPADASTCSLTAVRVFLPLSLASKLIASLHQRICTPTMPFLPQDESLTSSGAGIPQSAILGQSDASSTSSGAACLAGSTYQSVQRDTAMIVQLGARTHHPHHTLPLARVCLRVHLPHITEGGNLASVLEHCMYCGSSLSRVGLDFQGLLHPLFEECALHLFAQHLSNAVDVFNTKLESHKWVHLPGQMLARGGRGGAAAEKKEEEKKEGAEGESVHGEATKDSETGASAGDNNFNHFNHLLVRPSSQVATPSTTSTLAPLYLLSGDNNFNHFNHLLVRPSSQVATTSTTSTLAPLYLRSGGKGAGGEDLSPSYMIMEHLPLAVFCNAVLSAFNELRHCALLSMSGPVSGLLQ